MAADMAVDMVEAAVGYNVVDNTDYTGRYFDRTECDKHYTGSRNSLNSSSV